MDRDRLWLPAWALGTWHASFLLIAFILAGHAAGAAGPVTADIGTVPGLLAFAWLWLVSVHAARRVLIRSVDAAGGLADAVRYAGMHGAAAGALFVAGSGVVLVVGAVVEGGDPAALIGLVFVAFACVAASIVGALIGWLLLGIDLALLGPAARRAREPAGRDAELSPAWRQPP